MTRSAITKTVLITGGAGYIGSHIIVALATAGYRCVCVDNYSNSSPHALERVREIGVRLDAHEVDMRDEARLASIVASSEIESVIHLAGLKAVSESVERPLEYYDNNVVGTLCLLRVIRNSGIRRFVFSSSATVYGAPKDVPVQESAPTSPESPYARTKLMIEHILEDVARSDTTWQIANLRYFNPVGAHECGRIGENPSGVPNNLMPYVCQVAAGKREKLRVFGSDYPTKDGTGIRDYIHVMDLADGHVAALKYLGFGAIAANAAPGMTTVNLGTGRGYSVLEVIETFERVNGLEIPREFVARRPGDVAMYYANADKAKQILGWQAKRNLDDMCRDAWRWQQNLTSS